MGKITNNLNSSIMIDDPFKPSSRDIKNRDSLNDKQRSVNESLA
jgi:hypothetical protein